MKKRVINYSYLIFLSAVFYFISVYCRSFWGDEILSIEFSSTDLFNTVRTCIYDCHPPLYFSLLNIWQKLAGSAERSLRFFQAIQIFLLNLLTLKMNDITPERSSKATLLFFLSLSPFSLLFAPMLRYYTLTAILVLTATIVFIDWLNGKKKGPLLVIIYTLILYTDYPSSSIILAHLIYICLKNRTKIINFFKVLLVTTLLFLPWFIPFLKQLLHVTNPQHSADLSSKIFLQFILRIIWTLWSFIIGETTLPFHNSGIIFGIITTFLFISIFLKTEKLKINALWTCTFITGVIFTVTITTLLVKHSSFIYIGARSFFIFPFFVLIISRLISEAPEKLKKPLLITFLVFYINGNINLIKGRSFAMPVYAIPWRSIIAEIPEGSLLISEESMIAEYYRKNLNRTDILLYPPSLWKDALNQQEKSYEKIFILALGRDSTKSELPENFLQFLSKQKKISERKLLAIPSRYLKFKKFLLKSETYDHKVIITEYQLQ